jgi:hypothetical protein
MQPRKLTPNYVDRYVGTTCLVSMGSRVAENFKLTLQGSIIGCNAARMEGIRNAFKILVGKPEYKRPLGKHGCRLKDTIKMYIQDIQFEGVK